jgi:plasmid stabilization system protein ParE
VRIRLAAKAHIQLQQIQTYLAARNPDAADRVVAQIVKAIEGLSHQPYAARRSDYADVRVLTITRYPYLVFYRVDRPLNEIQILRIRHGARNPARHLD